MVTLSNIQALAAKWSQKHPDLAARLERAVPLTLGVKSQGEGVYVVQGRTDEYIVWADPKQHQSTCTCPDSKRGNHCKHRLAVALVHTVEQG